jgi:tetratricopeptide (TPR) repeat protein
MNAWVLLAFGLSTASVRPADEAKARALNTEGFRLYKAGKFVQASKKFERAWKVNPDHALAHYNYAATLGVFRKKNRICEHHALKQVIVEHLSRSVELDPSRAERMQTDPDFDSVRDTVGYQKLLKRDLPALLENVSWFGPGEGVWGSLLKLDFLAEGKVALEVKVPAGSETQTQTVTGQWKTSGSAVDITWSAPFQGRTQWQGRLNEEGALDFGAPSLTFGDEPSDCSA